MPIPGYRPDPAPPGVFYNVPLPEANAWQPSRITFQWVAPMMKVGYSRPIEPDDLWTLPDDLQCRAVADKLGREFAKRLPPSMRHDRLSKRNKSSRMSDKERRTEKAASPHETGAWAILSPWLAKKRKQKIEKGSIIVEDGQVFDMSLLAAMYRTVWKRWWLGVILKGIGAVLQVTAPLVTQKLIRNITVAHAYHKASKAGNDTSSLTQPKSVGAGVGLAAGLFAMLMVASVLVYHALQIGSVVGLMMRSALMDLIGRKSMRLSSKARKEMTNGRLTTMVTADASYLDFSVPMTLDLVVQPLQILVGLALILYTLGYSALVGLAILAVAGPVQAFMFTQMVNYRQAQLAHLDARVRLLSEVVKNIRAVKLYAYERLFGDKVADLRVKELAKLKINGVNRATMNATMTFIPTLAAVLTFITYGLSGHTLDAATIFTGLQFFNVLKTPIAFLPICFTAVSDAVVAIGRIGAMLRDDELPQGLNLDPQAQYAIDSNGSFTFETELEENAEGQDSESEERCGGVPFSLQDVALRVPKGALVCVIGRVGSGKSALLQGLLGEIPQTSGQTVFSDPVCYVPQQPWIHSGTVRDNLTFSASMEEIDAPRLQWVIDACCLRDDVNGLSNGLSTKVGEKGNTLSGGQRQRIALARAAYDSTSPIVLLDDPLSAVDAHVAHQILHNCILQGPLASRTRLLVTHRMDILPRADWIVVMDRHGDVGRIVQQGQYNDLKRVPGMLQNLTAEMNRPATSHSTVLSEARTTALSGSRATYFSRTRGSVSSAASTRRPVTIATVIYPPFVDLDTPEQPDGNDEERETGAVSAKVYTAYIRATGSWLSVMIPLCLLAITQLTSVANSLFLGFWSSDDFGLSQGVYMAVYAGLGFGTAIFTWSSSLLLFIAGLCGSAELFNRAWGSVLRATNTWHNQTPSGRIISRLSKDIEMLDDRLASSWEQFLTTALSVIGTFGLVLYTYPYLGFAFIPLTLFFYLCASYYRQTSREVKRVDSITRSHIYSSFGEQLNGLGVIRAFRKQQLFQTHLQQAIDKQCQAYIITITIQRWLGVRLDLFSNLLVLLIAIFGVLFRNSVNPANFGVVLTYTLSAAALFANVVSQYAQVEQEMNNAERILHYTTLPLEASPTLPIDPPPPWPERGAITFDKVDIRYRHDLPLVLSNLSFDVKPGEKIGVIGRTGAGKSTLSQALFRMVELESGRIAIDSKNIKHIGLDTLRATLGIIPQDAFLFEGIVRENIDPEGIHSDAKIFASLDLILSDPASTPSLAAKLRLDAQVTHSGENFSAGERQLLALVRALVKAPRVLLLDEATSSVDPETDALIQRVLQRHLSGVTLISIAHRLQTVAYYDRILVLEAGKIAEFDYPLRLYDNPTSIFRSLCDRVRLGRADLVRIKRDALFAANVAQDRSSLMYHSTIADAWMDRGPAYTASYCPTTPANSLVSQ